MPETSDDAMWDSIGADVRVDTLAKPRDERAVEREAERLSYQVVECRVRKCFARADGDTAQVDELDRKIGLLKAARRSLFIGREERTEEKRYLVVSWEEDCLEDVRDRLLGQIGQRIREQSNALAKGDTARASDLNEEIIALDDRRDSVYSLYYDSPEGAIDGPK